MSVSKYLAHYAEDLTALDTSAFPAVNHLVVIPAYNEPLDFIERLQTFLASQHGALAIVVLNQPDDELDITENTAMAEAIKLLPLYHPGIEHLYCVEASYIYLVDCFQAQRLPRKQGVGLARKIGCDVAVNLYAENKLASPWLHCTDADATLPADYFEAALAVSIECAAVLYPFKHFSDNGLAQTAVALYEMRLHWYVAGLQWAQSPYAYHTVGSTLAVNVGHYCKVRGFPKLAAGEDFHLLNKLAKTGQIKTLATPALALDGRMSFRVPFGTGRAVAELTDQNEGDGRAIFEAPELFSALKTVLASYDVFWQLGSVEKALAIEGLTTDIVAALTYCGFPKMLTHAYRQSTNLEQFTKQLNTAFDALQSRRFLHYLAANKHPNLSFEALIHTRLANTIMPNIVNGL